MAPDQFWLEVAKLAVTSVVSLIAAGLAVRIAVQQRDIAARQADTALESKRVAAAKVNLDLFEKRLECFQATWKILSAVHLYEATGPEVVAFCNIQAKVPLLFGAEVSEFVRSVFLKLAEFQSFDSMSKYSGPPGEQQSVDDLEESIADAKAKRDATIDWMMSQRDLAMALFGRYMSFAAWHSELKPLEVAKVN